MTSANDASQVLDNPAWHALNTNQARFALGTAFAKRYPSEVSVFAGIADDREAAFADLPQLLSYGNVLALVGLNLPSELPGWTTRRIFSVIQMVSQQPIDPIENTETIVNLTAADVPDMLQLVELTKPGPFSARTIELGHYVGIRKAGQLVAMAGERMHPPGYCEISAVCTDPEHQGKGYAQLLTRYLCAQQRERGDIPILHVAPDNERALKIYERLSFRERCQLNILVLSRA